jgi:FMN-dependent NADH-azoreductase
MQILTKKKPEENQMNKLLYISANPKPENLSASKTVARELVNRIIEKYREIEFEEVDLYEDHIPQLKHSYFAGRSAIISDEERKRLPKEEQNEVARIVQLCDQFRSADVYVLAAPMWSLSYPAPVKEYIDCVIQAGKTIEFEDDKPQGLLGTHARLFIYVQSSGAHIPWIIRPALNKGLNYVHDVMRFLGISRFEELLVDGTGTSDDEREEAVNRAIKKIDDIILSV